MRHGSSHSATRTPTVSALLSSLRCVPHCARVWQVGVVCFMLAVIPEDLSTGCVVHAFFIAFYVLVAVAGGGIGFFSGGGMLQIVAYIWLALSALGVRAHSSHTHALVHSPLQSRALFSTRRLCARASGGAGGRLLLRLLHPRGRDEVRKEAAPAVADGARLLRSLWHLLLDPADRLALYQQYPQIQRRVRSQLGSRLPAFPRCIPRPLLTAACALRVARCRYIILGVTFFILGAVTTPRARSSLSVKIATLGLGGDEEAMSAARLVFVDLSKPLNDNQVASETEMGSARKKAKAHTPTSPPTSPPESGMSSPQVV